MKLYLAGPYGDRLRIKKKADKLTALGFHITSRWVHGDHDEGKSLPELRRYAEEDLQDIAEADVLMVFTSKKADRMPMEPYSTTGGHHVEMGIAMGTGKEVILIGPPANVFHLLPQVRAFDAWSNDVVTALAGMEMTLQGA